MYNSSTFHLMTQYRNRTVFGRSVGHSVKPNNYTEELRWIRKLNNILAVVQEFPPLLADNIFNSIENLLESIWCWWCSTIKIVVCMKSTQKNVQTSKTHQLDIEERSPSLIRKKAQRWESLGKWSRK